MTSDASTQIDAVATPGSLLRRARLAAQMSEREVEDQLNLMPGYVGILERDAYQELRSPTFARGYVRSYAQLMKLDEEKVLLAFDDFRHNWAREKQRVETRPLQLQSTRLGIVLGLLVLALLCVALWLLARPSQATGGERQPSPPTEESVEIVGGGEQTAGEQ